MLETALWYEINMGWRAKMHFINGINKTMKTLAAFPNIGKIAAKQPIQGITLRSIKEHKNHIIIYYITEDSVHIADIWSTRMQH